ncbi:hypothetical protein AYO45_06075 [Gammaproteobacteria bacterium SCGC AG-212-F23]|nr:hypothetical protein AYO45_06075 [Gammaproteobacteria bacterium SCGC AG-212-F23]
MKKTLALIVSCIIAHTAIAADSNAQLRLKIKGAFHDNRYFVCLNNVGGCVSVAQGDNGRVYPINPGDIKYIAAIDTVNRSLNAQSLPASCQVNLNSNQTVTITGELTEGPNKKVYIKNMNCSVG